MSSPTAALTDVRTSAEKHTVSFKTSANCGISLRVFRHQTALSVLAVLRQANLEAGAIEIRVHTDVAPMLLDNAANCVEA